MYHLGIACFAIGQAALGQLDIRRVSLPYLQELNAQTRETIHLTVPFGHSAVYVEKLDSTEPLRIYSRIGAAVPLYCTAVGKVLPVYMSNEERHRILSQLSIRRLTPNTVGNLQELEAERTDHAHGGELPKTTRPTRPAGWAADFTGIGISAGDIPASPEKRWLGKAAVRKNFPRCDRRLQCALNSNGKDPK
jgi:Bacterial transcriptional regulator